MTDDNGLLEAARAALAHAHAPYSDFRVGAAVVTTDGRVFTGVNVENASYGLTMCAERVALFGAIAAGAREFVTMALTTERAPQAPNQAMPCGACRQVMAELMPANARVIVDRVGPFRNDELLPTPFSLATLVDQ